MVGVVKPQRAHAPGEDTDSFLMEAASLLASSLDYEETLAAVAQLAVRSLADFCVIDVVQDGEIRRLQATHADPDKAALMRELLEFPLDRNRPHLALKALDNGSSLLVPEVTDAQLETVTQGPEHRRVVEALEPRSLMIVPLVARERVIGVMLWVSSSRSYDEDDLALAERIARLASLDVENAEHYRDLQRALRERDRVLGVVAHDLRNPLNVIAMSAELLRDLPLSEDRRARQLEVILDSTTRMDRLIQDLLDVARMEGGRLQLRRQSHDPELLVREAVDLNAARAADKSLRLDVTSTGAAPPVWADRDRILRVLSNLIDNAVKFTPEGGHVEVRVKAVEQGTRFAVADTGPGIASDELPHLFQPFWQAQGGSEEGAGLGLAIARGIVEAHGGSIWAESVPGEGSTFHFTIPGAP